MIDLRFVARDLRRLDDVSAEVVACGVYRDARPFKGLAGLLDWRLAGSLSRVAKQGFLVGELGEVLALPARPRLPFDKLLAFGLGARASFNDGVFRQVLERALDAIAGLRVKKAVVELPGRGDDLIAPERAAEIVVGLLGDDERDALTFVEDLDAQRRFEKKAEEARRTVLRAESASAR